MATWRDFPPFSARRYCFCYSRRRAPGKRSIHQDGAERAEQGTASSSYQAGYKLGSSPCPPSYSAIQPYTFSSPESVDASFPGNFHPDNKRPSTNSPEHVVRWLATNSSNPSDVMSGAPPAHGHGISSGTGSHVVCGAGTDEGYGRPSGVYNSDHLYEVPS